MIATIAILIVKTLVFAWILVFLYFILVLAFTPYRDRKKAERKANHHRMLAAGFVRDAYTGDYVRRLTHLEGDTSR